ncbi:hypothetical protein EDD22DRAFT_852351, partial [Suillus occidentalis]
MPIESVDLAIECQGKDRTSNIRILPQAYPIGIVKMRLPAVSSVESLRVKTEALNKGMDVRLQRVSVRVALVCCRLGAIILREEGGSRSEMWQGRAASVALGRRLCAAGATDVAAGWGKAAAWKSTPSNIVHSSSYTDIIHLITIEYLPGKMVPSKAQSYSDGERACIAEGEGEGGGQAVAGGEGEEEAGKTFAKGGEAFMKAGKGDEYCRRLAEMVPEVGDCAETAETASRVTTAICNVCIVSGHLRDHRLLQLLARIWRPTAGVRPLGYC